MQKFDEYLEKMNGKIDKGDLFISYMLAKGCYNGHCGYDFTIQTLKMSINNTVDFFGKYNKNQELFWKKLNSFTEDELANFFKALKDYCFWMGGE